MEDDDDEIDLLDNSDLKTMSLKFKTLSGDITELAMLPFRKLFLRHIFHPLPDCLTRRRGIEKTEFRG